jgi:hypothetical protein
MTFGHHQRKIQPVQIRKWGNKPGDEGPEFFLNRRQREVSMFASNDRMHSIGLIVMDHRS